MQHQQVIDNFINRGISGRGTYVKTDGQILSSEFPQNYRPWGHWWHQLGGHSYPLAVRLGDGNVLVNGARLDWPATGHQMDALRSLGRSPQKFGVVPFHSIVAAFTGGEVRDWNRKPIPIRDLQREVGIVVPSAGERWLEVTEKDKHGRTHTRQVHNARRFGNTAAWPLLPQRRGPDRPVEQRHVLPGGTADRPGACLACGGFRRLEAEDRSGSGGAMAQFD